MIVIYVLTYVRVLKEVTGGGAHAPSDLGQDLVDGGRLRDGHREGDQVDRDVDLAHVDERDLVLARGRVDPVGAHTTPAGRVGFDDAAVENDPERDDHGARADDRVAGRAKAMRATDVEGEQWDALSVVRSGARDGDRKAIDTRNATGKLALQNQYFFEFSLCLS